jgi:hypothetical protein
MSRRSHILAVSRSSFEWHPSTFWNLAASLPTNFVWEVSLGECLSTESAAEDTAVQNVASSLVILVWRRVASRIPSDKCLARGGLMMAWNSSEP